jgi:tetratricopeptide (TPR) repeat protein
MRILEVSLKRLTDPGWWTQNGRAVAESALSVFSQRGERLDEARALHLIGKLHSDRGQQAAAAESLERALELATGEGDTGVEAWIRYWLLQVSTLGPTSCDRVIARARAGLEWARSHDNRALEGSTLGRMGEMLARVGEVKAAEEAFAQARDLFTELDLPVHVAYLALSTGSVEPLASDPPASENELRPAVEFFEESGARHIAASLLPMLASAVIAQGRVAEGLEMSERAEDIAAADDLDAQVRWRIATAEGLVAQSLLPERIAREAIDVAEPADMIVLEADSHACLAGVMLAARSPSEAVPALERALALYERKGDRVSASRTRGTLDSLAGTRFF